ncbi:ATP-binding protein [Desulfobaculum sp. SPO524]|uniref:ATP-binding protein n=1 Tax=Desulfobaculum sp. SPO524 TaxID=3378071 RepID=UPI003854F1EA
MKQFRNISLKNKIYFSILAVIMLISAAIALLARGILLESLTSELENRGVAIAESIADRGSGFVLDDDRPNLTALLFDISLLGERRDLVSYAFVEDKDGEVLAHTFVQPFPDVLRRMAVAGGGGGEGGPSVRQVTVTGQKALDIAVPMLEGIYRVATVHVGLNKQHIDTLVGRLRIMFLGFITLVCTIIFWISHRISSYITLPVTKLIEMSDEISKGNLNFKLDLGSQYADLLSDQGRFERCPAYHNSDLPCWHVDKTMGPVSPDSPPPAKPSYCRECVIRHKQIGDEVLQLADSFVYMVRSIRLYRNRLRESEAKYRSLFDAGPDPVFVVDAETLDILDVNQRCEEVYGYTTRELLTMRFDHLEDVDGQDSLRSFARGERAGGRILYPKTLHRRKDGEPVYVNMHACESAYGDRAAIVVSATDITDIVEKDAQLVQASKMTTLGEMSAGIAHELNQPLNAIRMGSDYLAMMTEIGKDIPEKDLRQVTGEIGTQIERATDIVNTLRQFGRKSELTPERLNLNDPVQSVLKIISHQLKLQNITVHLDLSEDLPPVQAHGNRLQQVFFNLISNARDAINMWSEKDGDPDDRVISITTFTTQEDVAIQVSDTGAGINPAQLDKIFEPFFTTKETGQGMGLGLAISYGIVKDYRGNISVDSQVGAGTTFTVRFPAAT